MNIQLPVKDDTSETTVRNFYGLFPDIHDSLELLFSLINHFISRLKTTFKAGDLILTSDRHILKVLTVFTVLSCVCSPVYNSIHTS